MSKFILDDEQKERVALKLQAALEEEMDDIYDADFTWGEGSIEQIASDDNDFERQISFTNRFTATDTDPEEVDEDE